MKHAHLDPLPESELVQWCRNQLNGNGNAYTARLAVCILRLIEERNELRED